MPTKTLPQDETRPKTADEVRMDYREISRAEMSPDTYDGLDGGVRRPRWLVSARGERGDAEVPAVRLQPDHFPPGTVVTVCVPLCPDCKAEADLCDCGFDWRLWAEERYS